ncbi:MAG: FAD-binding oxidoreductase [Paenarthrobacter ureafaciens]|uniref:FAD-dependent oxidoreductase n=1 Tax=Paenarthrobacter ureafaciens TaxID=37931 RepID=UPI001AC2163D|nr:FAD-binding oxidoreductase [Paenarthrobacter ureafaciens]
MVERISWQGTIIVGAGVSGILLSLHLANRGENVLLVDQQGLGGGQTGHCHGYIHRGYIYERITKAEIELLARGAAWWEAAVGHSLDERFRSVLGFDTHEVKDSVTMSWADAGLATGEAAPNPFSYEQSAMTVDEWSMTPVQVLEREWNKQPLKPSTVTARIAQLQPHDGGATAIAQTPQGNFSLTGDRWIITAGTESTSLIPRGSPSSVLGSRMSFMVVARSQSLYPDTFCLRTSAARGMFGCSRELRGQRYSLISNYVSFGRDVDHGIARWSWLQDIQHTLARSLPHLWEDPEALWGVYRAPKAEVNDGSMAVPSGTAWETSNQVYIFSPGKLTTAPALVEDFIGKLPLHEGTPASNDGESLGRYSPLSWLPELWTQIPLVSRFALFGAERGDHLVEARHRIGVLQ